MYAQDASSELRAAASELMGGVSFAIRRKFEAQVATETVDHYWDFRKVAPCVWCMLPERLCIRIHRRFMGYSTTKKLVAASKLFTPWRWKKSGESWKRSGGAAATSSVVANGNCLVSRGGLIMERDNTVTRTITGVDADYDSVQSTQVDDFVPAARADPEQNHQVCGEHPAEEGDFVDSVPSRRSAGSTIETSEAPDPACISYNQGQSEDWEEV